MVYIFTQRNVNINLRVSRFFTYEAQSSLVKTKNSYVLRWEYSFFDLFDQ